MSENNSKKNVWSFFINNYRLTYLILIGIVIFGTLAILNIPKESSPEIDIPVVVITTTLPGASAVDVEELVTNEIEKKVESLSDLDSLKSVSSSGFSQIIATFDSDSEGREKLTDVREKVSLAKNNLPSDAGDPYVQKINFSDRPILIMAVTGPYSPVELNTYAENLKDEFERIRDVSQVSIIGAPKEQIEVVINQEKLSQFNVSLNQVISGISQTNTDIPIGSIETANTVYTVRLDGRLFTLDDVKNTSISTSAGVPVFIKDISEVKNTFEKPNTVTRMNTGKGESNPSVTIQIFKSSGQGDILTVVDEAQLIIKKLKIDSIPEDVSVEIVENDAQLIRDDLSNLLTSGLFTILIVLLVLILFLGFRAAFLASLVVPLTFLITFAIIQPLGYTINFLTLFSLILALGILVDASIVVTESIFEKLSRKGVTPFDAALDTIDEFKAPLISGTLTTVFVFLPMLLMTGIMGKFIESIPITISIVLLAAIFVSLAIIPTIAIHFLKTNESDSMKSVGFVRKGIDNTYSWYRIKLSSLISNESLSKKFLWILGILFVVSISLPIVGLVKINMFPQATATTIFIDVNNPVGTPLSVTSSQLSDIEAILSNDSRIKSFLVKVGSGSNAGSVTSGNINSHIGSITVNLKDEKNINSLEIIGEYEKILNDSIDANVSVSQLSAGPAQGSPIQARIKGGNIGEIERTALDLSNFLKEQKGTRNINNGIEEGAGELRINVDKAKARSFGVSTSQISNLVRSSISGTDATVIKTNGNDIDVFVTSQMGKQYGEIGSTPIVSIEQIQNIPILTDKGPVPLSTLAHISLESSRASISHTDGNRVVTISSDVDPGTSATVVVSELQKYITTLELPEGLSIEFGGEAEDIAKSFASLGQAMIIGILMIFGLLIWQFKSLKQSLFVMSTIPLALVGVLPGLALVRQPLSFPGFIGIVALAGIVVNNAIILIDSINNNRRKGMKINEAVEESAHSRLQPILLTTITTIAGMIPLAFSDPSWSPLAFSIIFGLMFSTVLTLFTIPIMYNRFIKESEQE